MYFCVCLTGESQAKRLTRFYQEKQAKQQENIKIREKLKEQNKQAILNLLKDDDIFSD